MAKLIYAALIIVGLGLVGHQVYGTYAGFDGKYESDFGLSTLEVRGSKCRISLDRSTEKPCQFTGTSPKTAEIKEGPRVYSVRRMREGTVLIEGKHGGIWSMVETF